MTRRRSASIVALLAAVSASAHAQSPTATALFKEGRELARTGKHAEACAKFRKSQELDPQLGTLFNIAQCSEKVGKLATALAAYREVIAKDTNPERKGLAVEYESKLAPRVPTIVVEIDKPPPGLVVTIDGPTGAKPIDANLPFAVDLGDYTVVARADGYRESASKVVIDKEGETRTVALKLVPVHAREEPVVEEPHRPPPLKDEPSHTRSHRKTYGYVGVGVGAGAAATGLVFGVIARGKWNDAKAVCGGTTCTTQLQFDSAQSLADKARSAADLSTVLVVAGGAIAATGLVLWLTAPSDRNATSITASASATSTGVVVSGRF
jgi:hypothetical protein